MTLGAGGLTSPEVEMDIIFARPPPALPWYISGCTAVLSLLSCWLLTRSDVLG